MYTLCRAVVSWALGCSSIKELDGCSRNHEPCIQFKISTAQNVLPLSMHMEDDKIELGMLPEAENLHSVQTYSSLLNNS